MLVKGSPDGHKIIASAQHESQYHFIFELAPGFENLGLRMIKDLALWKFPKYHWPYWMAPSVWCYVLWNQWQTNKEEWTNTEEAQVSLYVAPAPDKNVVKHFCLSRVIILSAEGQFCSGHKIRLLSNSLANQNTYHTLLLAYISVQFTNISFGRGSQIIRLRFQITQFRGIYPLWWCVTLRVPFADMDSL